MRYSASAIFALAAIAAAQSTTVTYECAEDSASDCTPVTSVIAASSTAAAATGSAASCSVAYDNCRTAADANMATCAAQYAGCLGTNPFANTTASATGSAVYVTEVVTALTTYCPAATSLTLNGKVYTVSSATTLTVTDCPCTITKASSMSVATGASSMMTSAASSGSMNSTATTSKPVAYTGAAAHFGAGSGLVAALAGAAILL